MKKLVLIATIFIVLAVLSMPLTALAGANETVTRIFQPSSTDPGGDSWIDAAAVTDTHGSDPTLLVQRKNKAARYALVTFDISAIPSGSIISSATLSLWATATTATVNHGAHLITQSWTEAGVSWGTMPTYNTATTSVLPTVGEVQWSVGTDISALRDGTAYGWMIISLLENTGNESTTYRSREDATAAERPKLTVTYTAPWDSYKTDYGVDVWGDSAGDPFDDTCTTVFMEGTGFAPGTDAYKVAYYDKNGAYVITDTLLDVAVDTLHSSYVLTSQTWAAGDGFWHAVAYETAGTVADPYDAADTDIIANDSFYVAQSAIPEFPTIFAAIGVAGLCFGIYYWMRKRRLAYVKG